MKKQKVNDIVYGDSGITFSIWSLDSIPEYFSDGKFWLEFEFDGKVHKTVEFGSTEYDLDRLDQQEKLQGLYIPLSSKSSEIKIRLKCSVFQDQHLSFTISLCGSCRDFRYVKTLDFLRESFQLRMMYVIENYGPNPEDFYPFYPLFSSEYQFQPLQLMILEYVDSQCIMEIMRRVSRTFRCLIQNRMIIHRLQIHQFVNWEYITKTLLLPYRITRLELFFGQNNLDFTTRLKLNDEEKKKVELKYLFIECYSIDFSLIQSILFNTLTLEIFNLSVGTHLTESTKFKNAEFSTFDYSNHPLTQFTFYCRGDHRVVLSRSQTRFFISHIMTSDGMLRFPKLVVFQFPNSRTQFNRPKTRRRLKRRFLSTGFTKTKNLTMNKWNSLRLEFKKKVVSESDTSHLKTFSFMNIMFQLELMDPEKHREYYPTKSGPDYSLRIFLRSKAHIKFCFYLEVKGKLIKGIKKDKEEEQKMMPCKMIIFETDRKTKHSVWFEKDHWWIFHQFIPKDLVNVHGNFEVTVGMKLKQVVWEAHEYERIQLQEENSLRFDRSHIKFLEPQSQTILLQLDKFDDRLLISGGDDQKSPSYGWRGSALTKRKNNILLAGAFWNLIVKVDVDREGDECFLWYFSLSSEANVKKEGVIVADLRMKIRSGRNEVCLTCLRKEFSSSYFCRRSYFDDLCTFKQLQSSDASITVELEICIFEFMTQEQFDERKGLVNQQITELIQKSSQQQQQQQQQQQGPPHYIHDIISPRIKTIRDVTLVTIPRVNTEVRFKNFEGVMTWAIEFYNKRGMNQKGGWYVCREFPGNFVVLMSFTVKLLGTDLVMRSSKEVYDTERNCSWGFCGIEFPDKNIKNIADNDDRKFEVSMEIFDIIPNDDWEKHCETMVGKALQQKEDEKCFHFVVDSPYTTTQVGVIVDHEDDTHNNNVVCGIELCGIPFSLEFYPRGRDGSEERCWMGFTHQMFQHTMTWKFIVRILGLDLDNYEYVKEVKDGWRETVMPLCKIIPGRRRWKFHVKLVIESFKKREY